MIRAILGGRKTQTRRIAKLADDGHVRLAHRRWHPDDPNAALACPYGQPGDRLWVRETWGYRMSSRSYNSLGPGKHGDDVHVIQYKADGALMDFPLPHGSSDPKGLPRQRQRKKGEDGYDYADYLTAYWKAWRPSIFLPRWASRIALEIASARLERLKEISEEDAIAEGCIPTSGWAPSYRDPDSGFGPDPISAKDEYADLWESINGPGSWPLNPRVWVVEFRKLEGGEA